MASPWRDRVQECSYQHPWLLEDVALRALTSANAFDRAVVSLKKSVADASANKNDLQKQLQNVSQAARVSRHVGDELLKGLHA